jgi:DNA-directed RNA polymerase subunit M/transcription elongation factor TFIIS
MSTRWLRCPRCGTSDGIVVTEVHEEYGSTDPGRHEVSEGHIIPSGDFVFSPGDPVRVSCECLPCGHTWRSRHTIA